MRPFAFSKICPACGSRFVPWSLWRVTRWTFLRCPSCGGRLGRKINLQFLLIVVPTIIILNFIVDLPVAWFYRLALCIVALVVVYLVDVASVRLVAVENLRK